MPLHNPPHLLVTTGDDADALRDLARNRRYQEQRLILLHLAFYISANRRTFTINHKQKEHELYENNYMR